MAGLSKTKSDSLPAHNLTRNPKDLPIWSTDNGGFITIAQQNAFANTYSDTVAAFWTTFNQHGSSTGGGNVDTYQTILNISNATKPIIIGGVMSKYANDAGNPVVTTEFTVDGIVTEVVHTQTSNLKGRTWIGFINNEGVFGGTFTAETGKGLRFSHGVGNDPIGQYGYVELSSGAAIEDPMDVYTRGWGPLLYAEHSIMIRQKQSSIYNAGYWYNCGVSWRYLLA